MKNGDTGDVACDHYNRFAEDILLAKRLNLNSYRFSISRRACSQTVVVSSTNMGWIFTIALSTLACRTASRRSLPSTTGICRKRSEDIGGWGNRDVCKYFADFSAKCVERYGDRVKHWTTFNEPWCTSYLGYENGYHAPGKKGPEAGGTSRSQPSARSRHGCRGDAQGCDQADRGGHRAQSLHHRTVPCRRPGRRGVG